MGPKQLSEINGFMLVGSGLMGGNREQYYRGRWYYGGIGLVTLVASRQSRCSGTFAGQQTSFFSDCEWTGLDFSSWTVIPDFSDQ